MKGLRKEKCQEEFSVIASLPLHLQQLARRACLHFEAIRIANSSERDKTLPFTINKKEWPIT